MVQAERGSSATAVCQRYGSDIRGARCEASCNQSAWARPFQAAGDWADLLSTGCAATGTGPVGCTTSQARALYDKYLMEQPAPCVLFRGKGNISDFERGAYPKGLVVLWQDKAWVDRPLALEWAEDVVKPFVEAERKAGVANASTRYLLFQDNLDSQKQPDYIEFLRNWGVDDHKLPPNETEHQVQPIDRGLGRQVKVYIGQQVSPPLHLCCLLLQLAPCCLAADG